MTVPERIWANEGLEWHSFDCTEIKAGWTQPYILATPEALAASPEVQALIDAAVKAERERCARIAESPMLPCSLGGDLILDGYTADTIAAAIRKGDTP